MATEEHVNKAAFIKRVHASLRSEVKAGKPFEEVWRKHLASQSLLEEYSENMRELATKHWTKLEAEDSGSSRILWTRQKIHQYFHNGGIQAQLLKDWRRLYRHTTGNRPTKEERCTYDGAGAEYQPAVDNETVKLEMAPVPLKVLDVGSCYNPFSTFSELNVTGIDIAPAAGLNVLQCDFITVPVGDTRLQSGNDVTQLEKGDFDVVLFCLLLEYIPSKLARVECCEKARELLKDNGLLVIITPDSCHENKNSKQMKDWKEVLLFLGFQRVYYEKKTHFYGLAFRKLSSQQGELAHREMLIPGRSREEWVNRMYIPQDTPDNLQQDTLHNLQQDTPDILQQEPPEVNLKDTYQSLPPTLHDKHSSSGLELLWDNIILDFLQLPDL